jgi:SagB-type dehydrogenase family enzyme
MDEGAGAGPGAVARAFHEGTKHSWESVRRRGHFLDWDNRPSPFKLYEDLDRVPLPGDLPRFETSALEALLSGDRLSRGGGSLGLPLLAGLLFTGAGVLRRRRLGGDVYHFRTYASAGALYPVEVYVVAGPLPGLPAGVYHFDPLGFQLVRLREGDHRPHLVRAAAEPSVARAPAVLVFTGVPWKTAWKYTERGYRHLFWDAGMMLANLLAAAAAARLPARVVVGFADGEVEALLGLDGVREFPLCLVPLGAGEDVAQAAGPPDPVRLPSLPFSPRERVFEGIRAVNDAGRLEVGEVARWRSRAAAAAPPGEPAAASPEGPLPEDSLDEVVRRRGSARSFARGAMPAGVLATVLEAATRGVPTDYVPGGARLVQPYLVVNAVEGLAPGAYAWEGGPRLLEAGRFAAQAGYLCLEQRLGMDAAVTCFLMAPLGRVLDVMGDRGYRAAQLEAGVVGGRMYLAAYAHRFGATGLTFYDDEVAEFFSPHAAGRECMLVVALGESPRLRRPSRGPDLAGPRRPR